eukprot:COSAG06_NODE_8225_length_2232_cov_1.493671_1_plen_645_part_00
MQVTVAQQLPPQPQHQHQQPPQQSQHQQPLPPLQPQPPGLIVAGGADEDAGGGTHSSALAGDQHTSFRAAGQAVLASGKMAQFHGDRAFEAVHRGRYLRPEDRQLWSRDRDDAFSSDNFKPTVFAKSALYELFPAYVAVWIILIIERGNHTLAQNRMLSPFLATYWKGNGRTPPAFPFDVFIQPCPYVSFALWLWYRPESIDGWEVGFTLAMHIMRALVIGSKYAYYNDLDLGRDVGESTEGYRVEMRMMRKLASNWVCNAPDVLNSVLLEELYESCLRIDCDLAKAHFVVEPALAEAMWAEAQQSLDKACEEALVVDPNEGDTKAAAPKWGHSQELRDRVFGDEVRVAQLVAQGKLPASVVAWRCIQDCYYIAKDPGMKRMFNTMKLSFVMVWIAPLTRVYLGQSAFGETGVEKVILATGFVATFQSFWLVLLYVVLPSYDYWNRYRACGFMSQLMDHGIIINQPAAAAAAAAAVRSENFDLEEGGDQFDSDDDEGGGGGGGDASIASLMDGGGPAKQQHVALPPPRFERERVKSRRWAPESRLLLDMRKSQNVLAWSLVRRSVGCAGVYGHGFYARFQVYSLLLFAGSLLFTAAYTYSAKEVGHVDTVGFAHIMSRLAIVVGCLIVQVYFGYQVCDSTIRFQ